MLMRIARHNRIRMKFEKKYDDYVDGYGQDIEHMTLKKCYEKDKKLYKKIEDGKKLYHVASKPQRDELGLYEYVDQHTGYCEDDYYGTIWTKTSFPNCWLERDYHC